MGRSLLRPEKTGHARSSSTPETLNPLGISATRVQSSRISDVRELRFDEHSFSSSAPRTESTDSDNQFETQLSLAKAVSLMDMRERAESEADSDLQKAMDESLEYYRSRYQ
jgi:hypothetical protein